MNGKITVELEDGTTFVAYRVEMSPRDIGLGNEEIDQVHNGAGEVISTRTRGVEISITGVARPDDQGRLCAWMVS